MLLKRTEIKILGEFTSDKNKRIYGGEIARKFKLNQKTVSNILNNLEKENILKFSKEGKNKYYFLNSLNPNIKEIIKIVEINKKLAFTQKHKKFGKLFDEIVLRVKGIVIIFGSYAQGGEKNNSDLDLLVIGEIKEITDLEDSFNLEINVVKSTKNNFIKNEPFVKEIMENHIILRGLEEFVEIWYQ